MFIRILKKSDLADLMKFLAKIVEYHRGLDRYYKPFSKYKNLRNEIESWLDDKNNLILVAEEGEALVGYFRAGVERAPVYVDRDKIGIVYDVFVLKPYRQQGIAEMLFGEALKWFQMKKIKNIELNVDARNEAAIKFWRKHGFGEYKLRMRLDLK
ncbi:MAG: GNAT family N-acetyltransferase [Candidatus Harrisonbacteria bacterium]|nr:GNAT family N-acetyltransferase [Candidatus Harrisonbacteria bacterium]